LFDVDIGKTIPFVITLNGQPWNLSGIARVDLLVDGLVLPLTVIDPINGLAQYTLDGVTLRAGHKRANVRITYDALHVYHLPAGDPGYFSFRVKPLAA
jgi:hypothetical protein